MNRNNLDSLTTFNSDGRLSQIDYALNAVELSSSIIAVKSKSSCLIFANTDLYSLLLIINDFSSLIINSYINHVYTIVHV